LFIVIKYIGKEEGCEHRLILASLYRSIVDALSCAVRQPLTINDTRLIDYSENDNANRTDTYWYIL